MQSRADPYRGVPVSYCMGLHLLQLQAYRVAVYEKIEDDGPADASGGPWQLHAIAASAMLLAR